MEGLERARNRSGYSQSAVAAALGVSQAMVSYWESGNRRPNDRQLAALSRLYQVPVQEMLGSRGDSDNAADLTRMLFRGGDGGVPERARPGLRAFVAFLDSYSTLAGAVGYEVSGLKQSPFPVAAGYETADDARRKAEEVRAILRRGLGPIGDMDEVCELLGVTVFRASLGEELSETISGGYFNHPEIGFSILVNLDMTPGRRRFTIAHELAHALFHSKRDRFVISTSHRNPRERFADMFAGELLMPSEGICRAMEEHGMGNHITDPADAIHLQRLFNVSYATCLVRLRQARILSQASYEAFKAVPSLQLALVLGYDVPDEEFRPRAADWRIQRFPRRFLRLIRDAVQREKISPMTAAALTDLTIDEVIGLTDAGSGMSAPDVGESQEFIEHEALGVVA